MINFIDVCLQRGEQKILKNISWQIADNQHWAIVGENGTGKTTLLQAIAGKTHLASGHLEKPISGIELVSKDYSFNRIAAASNQYYQQRFNSQDLELSPTVRELLQNQLKPVGTVADNSICLPPLAYSEVFLQEKADLLRIGHLLDRPLISLSNGETRRLFLTKSLLKNPEILLLDKPFLGLDTASRLILHEIVNDIAQNGTQVILETEAHEMPACISHVLKLEGGKCLMYEKADFQDSQKPKKIFKIQRLSSSDNADFEYAVQMRNICISYGTKKVLDGVHWQIKRGERWALLGANGSGKSTLLSLITADNPQSYGNDFDLFDRKRGTGESIWDIKKRIGFVSPELHLYFTKSTLVYKAIASGLFSTNGLYQTLKPAERDLAEYYLELLNISYLSQKKFSEISTGEQRQVLLARALIKNPPLLVLDEPCQGLDHDKMLFFRELVNQVCVQSDKTLIYVSHYPEEIPDCVTQTLRLEAGKVIYP